MKKIYLSLSLLCLFIGQAQTQTYADDVAQIIFDNCTSCHHNGGIAPFSLMNYTDVSSKASWIQTEVNSGNMPPWSPDDTYSQFAHARSLTTAEITTINNWVNAGAPQGNPANTPPPPVYNPNNWQLGTPDLSIRIPDYISKATFGNDDYVCFSVPTNLVTAETIQAIEVIPGDPSIVHHLLAYIDANNTYGTDTLSHSCGGPTNLPLIAGYTPGSSPSQFPNSTGLKMGINLPANSRIIFAMHYPEGSQGKMDSTRINFHFYPQGTSGVRQVSANPVLSDYSFTINSNTIDSVDAWFPSATLPVSTNYSFFSIFPHAHLLGKNFIVYAVNHFPPYDKIPLIHIPKWDFDWQGFYVFKYLQKMPAGYKLYGKAVYDNTTNNPYNPNNPPQNISFGLNTTDEMFLVYFQYMPYQTGDELINIDSLLQLQNYTSTAPIATNQQGVFLTSYPNPSNDLTTIQYYTQYDAKVELGIYNLQGKLVKQLLNADRTKGEYFTAWDGRNDTGTKVPAGIYISQLHINGKTVTHKIVRH
ncbi:T9SS type A sorting domain-containing protein [Aureispira anguillae]|uniref:T9SS type A sorting domain-containing protein n=1 Tax=Aureispira anguillae TaxID=2864201 RepID=A0A916DVG9_9BACT|nr:T9SS type A sorting domain-containing protein [Aureispira anguillae]BDS13555.1 T9SS type A sorting domain-containing protein [Aureispira anguillae]